MASPQWQQLTLYDVIPAPCRAVDDVSFALKDFGDPAGDAYYAVRSMLVPLLCDTCMSEDPVTNPNAFCVRFNGVSVGTCYSEQAYEGAQVTRKIVVEVATSNNLTSALSGGYGACNPPADAEDEESMCTYSCDPSQPGEVVSDGIGVQRLTDGPICNATVGELVGAEYAAKRPEYRDPVRALLYDYNLCRVLDGSWYSSGPPQFANTLWRNPRLVKAVDAECQMRVMQQTVRAREPACFDGCPREARRESEREAEDEAEEVAPYDETSDCYIRCFYNALLGPDADTPEPAGGGMSKADIEGAWLRGIDECPEYVDEADEEKHSRELRGTKGMVAVKERQVGMRRRSRRRHAAHALAPA